MPSNKFTNHEEFNNYFYSFNMGFGTFTKFCNEIILKVHFISISTEIWFYKTKKQISSEMQIEWLKNDLEYANKEENLKKRFYI